MLQKKVFMIRYLPSLYQITVLPSRHQISNIRERDGHEMALKVIRQAKKPLYIIQEKCHHMKEPH